MRKSTFLSSNIQRRKFVIVDSHEIMFPVCLETEVDDKSGDEFLLELASGNFFVSQLAKEKIKLISGTGEKATVKFARAKVRDLGFSNFPPAFAEFWARVKNLGHSLCRPSDGPALRLALVQPISDYLLVAMEQTICSGGIYQVFILEQYYKSAPCLKVILVRRDHKLNLDTEVIFRLGKPYQILVS